VEIKDPTQTSFVVSGSSTTQIATIRGGLAAGTTYNYRLRFTNGTSSGAYSQVVAHSTPVPVLSAEASAGTVTLSISGTSSAYFMVYRSTDGVNFSYVGWTKTGSFSDSGPTSGTWHYYVKSWNNGQPSNTASLTVQ
jgi:hypothetical protein